MDLYQSRLLAEGIRLIEKTRPSNKFNAAYSDLTFEDAVLKRARLADLRYQISPTLNHLQSLFKQFSIIICLGFLMLGVTSVSQLLITEEPRQINFFWALLLFIVPNLLSLVIWLFLYFNSKIFSIGWIASVSLSIMTFLDKWQNKIKIKQPYYIDLFQYYFEHRFTNKIGRRQLSFLSHLYWCCYLLGATLSLSVLLATHQVDFVWQTTILTESTFLSLTELLAYLPNLLMIHVPTTSDVVQASIDIVSTTLNTQYMRIGWANLLFFSLVFYALLPRFILVLIFYFAINYDRKHFHLNLSLPYYVQLKNILQPTVKNSFIKDPDDAKKSMDVFHTSKEKYYDHVLTIPLGTYAIAIELNNTHLQQANSHAGSYSNSHLINALDYETQNEILSALALFEPTQMSVYVDIERSPDRGWLSFINKCYQKSKLQVYVILLGNEDIQKNEVLSVRLQDWIEMASKVNISAEYITYLKNSPYKIEVENE